MRVTSHLSNLFLSLYWREIRDIYMNIALSRYYYLPLNKLQIIIHVMMRVLPRSTINLLLVALPNKPGILVYEYTTVYLFSCSGLHFKSTCLNL